MAFGSLLGGIVTLIGTSPNIIVSRVREQIVGEPFGMFDFTPVGIGIAIAGVAFLTFAWRLLPHDRKGAASMDAAFMLEGYTTEASVPKDSPAVGKTVGELEAMADDEVEVFMIVRGRTRHFAPADNSAIRADDVLLIEGEPAALDRIVDKAKLELAGEGTSGPRRYADRRDRRHGGGGHRGFASRRPHAIAGPARRALRRAPAGGQPQRETHHAAHARGAASRRRRSRAARQSHDDAGNARRIAVPAARGDAICDSGVAAAACCRSSMLGARDGSRRRPRRSGGDRVLRRRGGDAADRALTLREAYEAIDWPILIMLGALIPVSDALRTTGGTDLIAGLLSATADRLPALGALALIMVAAMAVTPFLNNAATVLVMAPIAASFANSLGYSPDPFLMAVAIGAACDFLTPIGHQCNLLVMGPGGYSFGDYWRLGLPLSIMVVARRRAADRAVLAVQAGLAQRRRAGRVRHVLRRRRLPSGRCHALG